MGEIMGKNQERYPFTLSFGQLMFWIFGLAALGALIIFIYSPSFDYAFGVEDYYAFLTEAMKPVSSQNLFKANNDHFYPLFRVWYRVLYGFLGHRSQGYYLAQILFHIANAYLTVLFFLILFEKPLVSFVSGLLFGISFSYAGMFFAACFGPHVLALFLFLIGSIAFLLYLKEKNILFLLFASSVHFLSLYVFEWGLAVPVLYGVLLLALDLRLKPGESRLRVLLLLILPFLLNDAIYLIVRCVFAEPESSKAADQLVVLDWHLSNIGLHLIHLPKAVIIMADVFYRKFLFSFLGVPGVAGPFWPLYGGLLIGLFGVTVDFHKCRGHSKKKLFICLFLWAAVFVYMGMVSNILFLAESFTHALFRQRNLNFHHQYLAAVPASGAFALLFLLVWTGRPGIRRWIRAGFVVFIGFVVWANAVEIRRQEKKSSGFNLWIKQFRSTFARDLTGSLRNRDGVVQILKGDQRCSNTIWFSLDWLPPLYLSGPETRRIRVVESIREARPEFGVYWMDQKGHLRFSPNKRDYFRKAGCHYP